MVLYSAVHWQDSCAFLPFNVKPLKEILSSLVAQAYNPSYSGGAEAGSLNIQGQPARFNEPCLLNNSSAAEQSPSMSQVLWSQYHK